MYRKAVFFNRARIEKEKIPYTFTTIQQEVLYEPEKLV
ncbi:hypothetical protein QY97_00316 [Bacillus thermotolerans]|uniref:Uncharacterized protein n=1 Tax=Bacillus thermotolerans TaxID=1221996 RepID=A0A0F5I2N5_BACTR|nr:hypothetical protein QY97_00316 [Bacillus thermotolerans]KKB39515.1 hypothetical protein QY95_02363 [Bacillus thermotolerans]KKB44151.1 hypothetical protein QY96_03777 [Bacillus thermotolerans]